MYKDFKDSIVNVIVSSKGDTILEYNGLLVSEDDKTIHLNNVTINYAMLNYQRNMFGGGISSFKQNLNNVVINKEYKISCNR